METILKVKLGKNPPEQIVDHTPATPFTSPLERYIQEYCAICNFYKSLCRPHDQNGLKNMELCIRLYCAAPPDVNQILKEAMSGLNATQKTAELTLEDAEK